MSGQMKKWGLLLSLFWALAQGVMALEVGGVKFDEKIKLANTDLVLNGAGLRTKAIFKVYAAALYLPEKKNTVADIMALSGPRRVVLVMLREVSSEDFGQSFMTGFNNNSSSAEKKKLINQTVQFGEVFTQMPSLKKGDVLTLDWIPGPKGGTQSTLNGKPVGDLIQEQIFFDAVLRIWLGDKPADSTLKPQLLGEAAR
jgi:hypothetical protein